MPTFYSAADSLFLLTKPRNFCRRDFGQVTIFRKFDTYWQTHALLCASFVLFVHVYNTLALISYVYI